MQLTSLDRECVLRFAASFLWADHRIEDTERTFFASLAEELGAEPELDVARLLAAPPAPEDVDPTAVPRPLAGLVRHVALRAIAADGFVDEREMEMFELLDDLLPESPVTRPCTAGD